ncbi:uncharacterized protein [Dermacentor andersoni]|uniref:uncharacterized protein n=1 Tax=Dermacentor andersoni TaxID=34620 RepID=UPI002155B53E|nr:uncharacterized protein LOC126527372 [Dermacentor andersoni]XP_054924671.1 uncharacterized protein LOC126527372 [Dermacentor andersoni]XP_054924672.1 uncharacterized protein LOC126527372 [Dermacentor andersoni]
MATSKANGATNNYQNVKGRVYSTFRIYGFIDVDLSLNDRVYFNRDSFEDGRYADLLASGLKAGDRVIVDFAQRPGTDRYRALSVRREGYAPQRQQTAEEKLPSYLSNEEGVICVLRESHAYVRVPRFRGVTASFQKSDLEAYMGRRVVTLTDVLELGLKLRFDAMRNPDERSKTKWIVEKLRLVDGVSPATAGGAVTPPDSKPNTSAEGRLVGRRGRVLEVSSDHAMVRYGAHRSNTAYMHASVVEKSLGVDIEDLRDVLEEGSRVRFDADANGFQYGRGKWHVTYVELLDDSSSCASVFSVPSSAVSLEALAMSRLFADGLSGTVDADELYELPLEPRSRLGSSEEEEDRCDVTSVRTDVTDTRSRRNVADECRRSPYLVNDDDFPALPSHVIEEKTPSVSIYENVSAVVASVTASTATCYVEQSGSTRTVRFGARCFYRNGEPASGNLWQTLGKGDAVTLDFMVGTRKEGGDIVHCDLAWQGRKPLRVSRMSAEEMLDRLGGSEQLTNEDELFLHETIDDDELSALLGESAASDSDQRGGASEATEEDANMKTDLLAEAAVNGVERVACGDDVRYVLTEKQVPAFARLILQQLATASHQSKNRVNLRHASTQTELEQ